MSTANFNTYEFALLNEQAAKAAAKIKRTVQSFINLQNASDWVKSFEASENWEDYHNEDYSESDC